MSGGAEGPRLVLASASPRRREMLERIGLRFVVAHSGVDESPLPGETAPDHARRVARAKAQAVAALHPAVPVLGADTVVELDGRLLGKPASETDAAAMLRALSGRRHRVHTAVALVRGDRSADLVDTAAVDFLPLDEAVIRWYVRTGEPSDKAGAYAVQGAGGLLVRSVEGSPATVVGLPLHRLAELWSALGLDLWRHLRQDAR